MRIPQKLCVGLRANKHSKGFQELINCQCIDCRSLTDPKDDTTILLENKQVTVPQGKPIPMATYNHSSFFQSEYLIYKESQCRLRYLLKMKFGH